MRVKVLAVKRFMHKFVTVKSVCALVVLAVAAAQAVSSIFGPVLPYIWAPKSSEENNSSFVGLWYQEYQYPDRGGIVRFKGTTQYFRNKTYSVSGSMQLETQLNGKPFSMYFDVDATGEWQSTQKELITKILNMNSPLSRIESDGNTLFLDQYKKMPSYKEIDLSSKLLMGQSQSYDILSTSQNKIVLETSGLQADVFKIEMNSTKQRYLH